MKNEIVTEIQVFLTGDTGPEVVGEYVSHDVIGAMFYVKFKDGDREYSSIIPIQQIRMIRIHDLED